MRPKVSLYYLENLDLSALIQDQIIIAMSNINQIGDLEATNKMITIFRTRDSKRDGKLT